jgi:HD-GYP domain-containing protein (c-di-GMP phosphodiesterase class II)
MHNAALAKSILLLLALIALAIGNKLRLKVRPVVLTFLQTITGLAFAGILWWILPAGWPGLTLLAGGLCLNAVVRFANHGCMPCLLPAKEGGDWVLVDARTRLWALGAIHRFRGKLYSKASVLSRVGLLLFFLLLFLPFLLALLVKLMPWADWVLLLITLIAWSSAEARRTLASGYKVKRKFDGLFWFYLPLLSAALFRKLRLFTRAAGHPTLPPDWALALIASIAWLPVVAPYLVAAYQRAKRLSLGRRKLVGLMPVVTRAQVDKLRHSMELLPITVEFVMIHQARRQAAEAQNPYMEEHSAQVSKLADLIATQAGLSRPEIEEIRTAGMMHDIGKLGVPEDVLKKATPLTAQEYELVKKHADLGAKMFQHVKGKMSGRMRGVVRHHHERYDGTGYPNHLKGDKIPLGARIVAVAEALHDMVSDHPYKSARPFDDAVAEIRRCSGTQFDPKVVTAFLDWVQTHGDPRKHEEPPTADCSRPRR